MAHLVFFSFLFSKKPFLKPSLLFFLKEVVNDLVVNVANRNHSMGPLIAKYNDDRSVIHTLEALVYFQVCLN